jgi:hypothetical protein
MATPSIEKSGFKGDWEYHSFLSDYLRGDLSVPDTHHPGKTVSYSLDDVLFAEAVITLSVDSHGSVSGTILWDGGGLELSGKATDGHGGPATLIMTGTGSEARHTAGWQYSYIGYLDQPCSPDAKQQIPCFVGTVKRDKPHGTAPAGVINPFICLMRKK